MSRLNIKPATNGLHHHSYNPMILTTLDFGQLVPIESTDCVPTDDFKKVNYSALMRVSPQIFPPFGKCYLKHATFFVPEHQVVASSDAFHQDMAMWKCKSVVRPYIIHHRINAMFASTASSPGTQSEYGLATLVGSTVDPIDSPIASNLKYDFHMVYKVSNAPKYYFYRLTSKGRLYYKILKSLGIDFASFTFDSSYDNVMASADSPIDLMSYLSYLKVYTDMFLNGQFYNGNPLVRLMHCIHDSEDFTLPGYSSLYNSQTGEFKFELLFWSLSGVLLPHEQNMYTEAWNSPNSPDGVSPSTQLINGDGLLSPINPPVNNFSSVVNPDADKNVLQQTNGQASSFYGLTDLGLRFLQSFSSFVRRFNLFGNKAVQRVFANFGIKTDDFNSHFVHKLDEGSQRLDFYPVLSNTDNYDSSTGQGKVLGAYSGFSALSMNINYSHKCSDYGTIVTLVWLQIVPILIHGTHPKNLRRHPFDWFTPQFDGQAIRAIPKMEVSINKKGNDSNYVKDKSVYGFTEIYQEYCEMRDSVSGDFLTSETAQDFFFGRDLSKLREDGLTLAPQTNSVQYYDQEGNEDLSDPFQMEASEGDRMWLIFDGEIEADRPKRSESDSLMLNGSGNLTLPKNGVIMN